MSKLKKALEKAKETREQAAGAPAFEELPEPVGAAAEEAKDILRTEVNPVYQQTRVVNVESAVFRNNKIVSFFCDDAVADQIKILRTQILKRVQELAGNTLLITSAHPGEGKTLTAINLAVSIAQELNRTVLLVDANLRKPMIHRYLGFSVDAGLSDHLTRKVSLSDCLVNPGIEKLTILPGGRPVNNSSEILGAPRMEALVKEMKSRYPDRFIIFDSPSLLSSADPLAFSKFVDGVLLVVEAERTDRRDLRRALDLLKGRPVVGTLLNKARD
jgi:non-specific protein-tyrosine kinase